MALLLGLASGLLLALPAQSSAVTFGANLSRAPENLGTCASLSGGLYGDCSFDFTDIGTGESVFPPAGRGIITRVRVRVGPVTGPMQVVVEQALRYDNTVQPGKPLYTCCEAIAASQVFTPAPNTTTTVPVNLRIRQDLAPDQFGVYTDQHLALSVLAPNVPIPAASSGTAQLTGWFPAWRVPEQRAGGAGFAGAVILFNAEWTKCNGAGKSGAQSSNHKKKKKKKKGCGKKKKKKKR